MRKKRGRKKLKKSHKIGLIILFLISIAVLIVFSLPSIIFSPDETVNSLIVDTVPRFVVGADLVALIILLNYKSILKPFSKDFFKTLLWCAPCFLVALANFPFSALILGKAVIERHDLLGLFILKCLSIGVMEELFFRGIVLTLILEKFEKRPNNILLSIIISSAIFGLFHLVNLFFGANTGATMLQVGYSFLIGAMLSVVLIKTKNVWLCALIHALFNFGGGIVTDLGSGPFQDFYFWLLTAIFGAICILHILYTLHKTSTCYAFKAAPPPSQPPPDSKA